MTVANPSFFTFCPCKCLHLDYTLDAALDNHLSPSATEEATFHAVVGRGDNAITAAVIKMASGCFKTWAE